MCSYVIGEDTPSPQVGSPKIDSDMNDSPPHHLEAAIDEGEDEMELERGIEEVMKTGEEGEVKSKEDKGEDPCTRSEGVVHFVLSDLTNMESRLSDPIVIRNVPW